MYKTLKFLTPIALASCAAQNGHRFVAPASGTKASVNHIADFLRSKRVIYFGEIHGIPKIINFQETVLDFLVKQVREETKSNEDNDSSKVIVIMEHFAGPKHQNLIDRFMNKDVCDQGELTIEGFLENYIKLGEGHNLLPYANLLQYAKMNSDVVELKAGFIPRSYARLLVKDGLLVGLEAAYEDGYLDREGPFTTFVPGSDNHYNFFESLISGRDLSLPPSERFRKIFPAQILKDAAMAHIVVNELRSSIRNKFLVICGAGHCEYRFGVPERVDATNVIPKEESCIISTRNIDHYDLPWDTFDNLQEDSPLSAGPFEKVDDFENKFPADFILFYDTEKKDDELEIKDVDAVHMAVADSDQIKTEISRAYDQVSATAHLEGNALLAATVMKFLDYTEDEIRIAGTDGYNYQGVGNPHKHAHINEGDCVLDLGSGLGVDSFIAAERVGAEGKVIGLDISKGEVVHARKRAMARGVDGKVNFITADMESMPLESNSVDVVISNGAFCLAPNKEKAFKEIFRVLKPGGHFSVACTTLLKELDGTVNWPVCMRVFMPLAHVRPMLDDIGFQNVKIDSSNHLMVYSLEVETGEQVNGEVDNENETGFQLNPDRKKIHVGSEEFRHLEQFDMNALCARVILQGRKPVSE